MTTQKELQEIREFRHKSESCMDCGRHYLNMGFWWAPKALWKELVGEEYAGTLCPDCFGLRAWKRDLILKWVPRLDWEADSLPFEIPWYIDTGSID